MSIGSAGYRLQEISFSELPGWQDDDPSPLLPAIEACLKHVETVKPYRSGSLGLTSEDLHALARNGVPSVSTGAAAARAFFEDHCQPFRIQRDDGAQGLVTAFYEPEIEVAEKADSEYCHPFYRRPTDLVDVGEDEAQRFLQSGYRFGLKEDGSLRFYPDRKDIDQGYLDGRGLEIAWARSKVDVFFVHVQGAARLRCPDGTTRRITYAAKAGHPFSAIGKLLIERGEIPAAEISMQSIRAWLAAHPDQVDEVLWHNRSYIFFREAEVADTGLGPVAAAKVPLVAGRSLAVDRDIHTFGFPFFIHAETLTHLDDGKPFARLMLALDTGSAIVGPARGDIFTGSGFAAGELAGTVRNAADFYILIPKSAAQRYRS